LLLSYSTTLLYPSFTTARTTATSILYCKLDYCNSLYYNLSKCPTDSELSHRAPISSIECEHFSLTCSVLTRHQNRHTSTISSLLNLLTALLFICCHSHLSTSIIVVHINLISSHLNSTVQFKWDDINYCNLNVLLRVITDVSCRNAAPSPWNQLAVCDFVNLTPASLSLTRLFLPLSHLLSLSIHHSYSTKLPHFSLPPSHQQPVLLLQTPFLLELLNPGIPDRQNSFYLSITAYNFLH